MALQRTVWRKTIDIGEWLQCGLPYLVVILAMGLARRFVYRALGRPRPVGDEAGYIACGALSDPHAPILFLRVPMMAWLSTLAHRLYSHPERALRAATEVASAMSVLASMISVEMLGGPQLALMTGLLLAWMPGRVVLARHIWPDPWLGLWLSLACMVLIHPELPADARALLLGGVAALAFLTRFDALLLAPFAALGMASSSAWHWCLIVLPTAIAFAGLSLINARRYGIAWPDNTWMFNVMIAAGEANREGNERVLVQRAVTRTLGDWLPRANPDRFAATLVGTRTMLARPVRALHDLVVRLWASMGPDSFVLQRLLPPHGNAYPDCSAGINPALQRLLRIAFPLFASSTILAVWVAGAPAAHILWPTLALAAGSLIHSRTRYRQAWLPGAVLLLAAAVSAPGFCTALLSQASIPAWVVCACLAAALILRPVRPELRQEI